MLSPRTGVIGLALIIALLPPRAQGQGTIPPPSAPSDDLHITQAAVAEVSTSEDEILAQAPSRRSLSGALHMDIGSWGPRHSYMVPGFAVLQGVALEPQGSNSSEARNYTSIAGQAQAIQYFGKGTEFRYIGAIRFDSEPELVSANKMTHLHGANLSHEVQSGGWNLLFNEQVQYSKGSLLSGTGLEGMGGVVTQLSEWSGNQGIHLGSVDLQGGLAPDQSILSLDAGRVSSSTLLEIDRLVGDRSLVTASAFYGLLHFDASGLTDGWQKGAFGGYERTISSRDRLGGIYGQTQIGFSGLPYRFMEDYASVMYAHSLSQQLAIELGCGPQRLTGSEVRISLPALDWQGKASLVYHRKTLDLSGSAMRTITGGSGVLNGARTNLAQVNVGHRITRIYEARYSAAVSRNTGIVNGEQYSTQFVDATLERNATRGASLFVTYTLQRQQASGCVSGCSFTGLRQLFGVGLNWGPRPIGIP